MKNMFGFTSVHRDKDFSYKNNFLRSVIFQIKYPANSTVINVKDKIIELLIDNYSNHQDVIANKFEVKIENKTQVIQNVDITPQGIGFSTKDGKKHLIVSEDNITYTINGTSYINFESFYKDIEKELFSIFKLCNISIVNRVAIRKINLLEFTIQNNMKPIDALGILFNNELINNFLLMPGRNHIKRCTSSINLEEGNYRLNLTYGLMPALPNIEKRNAILDIDLFNVQEDLAVEDLKIKTNEINEEIFNIFSWALQQSTIEQLSYATN